MELHFKHVKAEDAELLRLTGELDAYFLEKYDDLTKRYQKHHRLDAMDCRMRFMVSRRWGAAAGSILMRIPPKSNGFTSSRGSDGRASRGR